MLKTAPRDLLSFLRDSGVDVPEDIELIMFGDSPDLADELAELVARGPKRATTSLPAAWHELGEPLPTVSQMYVVTRWNGTPAAIIQNTRVDVLPFCEVDARYAYEEGEGDRSLESWRAAHRGYFLRECRRLKVTFSEEMPVICQRFRVLYPRRDGERQMRTQSA